MPTPPSPQLKAARAKRRRESVTITNQDGLVAALTEARQLAAESRLKTAQYDKERLALEARHLGPLKELEDRLKRLEAAIGRYFLKRQATLLPPGRRSMELAGSVLRVRSNGGAVSTDKGVRLADVLEALQAEPEDHPLAAQLLAWKCSLDKDAAKQLWEDHAEDLQAYGLTYEETDLFSVDYQLEDAAA